jgi:hypothetical protein
VSPAKKPDKSKRYKQNRAVREARAARSARAGEATAIARGERAPTPAPSETPNAGGKGATRASGRPRRKSPYTIPGQRAVVLAFMFSIVSAATLILAPIQVPRDVPADDPRVEEGDERNDDGTVRILEDGKLFEEETVPVALAVVGLPIAITGAALWFTKRPRRSTAWSIAMVAMAAYVFFAGAYAVIALPSLVALGVAGFQSRRAESKERLAEIKANRAARKGVDGSQQIIDAEAVETPADSGASSDSDAPSGDDTSGA